MPLYILALVGLAQGWLGISVLYAVTGSLSVIGIYYLISSSASLLGILYTPLTSVLFPSMSYKFGESGHGAIRDTIRAVEGLVFYVALTVSLSVAAVSRPLLTLFYGSAYAADSLLFSVLAMATIFGALGGVYGTGLSTNIYGRWYTFKYGEGDSTSSCTQSLQLTLTCLSSFMQKLLRVQLQMQQS